MISFALAVALAGAGSAGAEAPSSTEAGSSPHFAITAQFRPGKTAGAGEVAVTFAPKDPDVKINVTPPPRLKLDEGQKVLAEKVAPKHAGAPDEKYLDLTFPVVFPVSVLGSRRLVPQGNGGPGDPGQGALIPGHSRQTSVRLSHCSPSWPFRFSRK